MAFKDIIGHKYPISILKKAVLNKRIFHSYLFLGPERVGKTTVALNFAKVLYCQNSVDGDSCDECDSCYKIDTGIHPDVQLLNPDGVNIKIEQTRAMQRAASFKSYGGNWKIFILPLAERLSTPAANSILRILEEPPANVVLILISTSPESIIPTIRSRCQTINFSIVPIETLKESLAERFNLDTRRLEFISRLSEGKVGKVLNLIDNKELLEHRENVMNIIQLINTRKRKIESIKIANELERLIENKDDKRKCVDEIIDNFISWYRDLLLIKENISDNLIINIDRRESLIRKSRILSLSKIEENVDFIFEIKRYIQRNANITLCLQVMIMKLMEGDMNA